MALPPASTTTFNALTSGKALSLQAQSPEGTWPAPSLHSQWDGNVLASSQSAFSQIDQPSGAEVGLPFCMSCFTFEYSRCAAPWESVVVA